jgi:hypothetical protein
MILDFNINMFLFESSHSHFKSVLHLFFFDYIMWWIGILRMQVDIFQLIEDVVETQKGVSRVRE